MWLGRRRIVGDKFDDAGELLNLKECMAQAELGDGSPGRVDHPSTCGRAASKRLQYRLAARRCRLYRRRIGRDSEQPHHVKTPPARTPPTPPPPAGGAGLPPPSAAGAPPASTAFTRR